MATMKDTAATGALNEEDYINKLYDQMQDRQKQLLTDAYSESTGALDTAQQEVQKQADTNLQRTDVEAQKTQQGYKPANVTGGINQQTALAMGNQQRRNTATLQDAQAEADAEIERRRLLLGQQYAKAIEQARADNDMLRAEQLYKEAQDRDAQIRALKTEAGQLLAAQGDNSVLTALLEGGSLDTSGTGETWSDVLKNEGTIDQIYDSANESARLQAEATAEALLSRIRADQEQQEKEADRKLTETYVNALRQGKNYDEVQGAYGLGSGNKAQARLARALGTTQDMTDLRGAQTGANAAALQQIAAAIQDRNATVTDAVSNNELKRVQALYDAAEKEEQALIDTQRTVGMTLAEQGDFSVLGKLYGLTQDQIDRLQGTGAYAPKEEEKKESSGGSSTGANNSGGTTEVPFEKDEEAATPVPRDQLSPRYEPILLDEADEETVAEEKRTLVQQDKDVVSEVSQNPGKVLDSAFDSLKQYTLGNVYTQAAVDAAKGGKNTAQEEQPDNAKGLLEIVADAYEKEHPNKDVKQTLVNAITSAAQKTAVPESTLNIQPVAEKSDKTAVSQEAKQEIKDAASGILNTLVNAFVAAAEKTVVPESDLKIPTPSTNNKSGSTSQKSTGSSSAKKKQIHKTVLRE